ARDVAHERAPARVPEDVAEAFDELRPHRGSGHPLGNRLRRLDQEEQERGSEEAHRVDDDREGRGDRANKAAGEAWAGNLGRGPSTQTPAGSAKRSHGDITAAPRRATSNALASTTSTAAKGSASCVTWEPSWLTV